MIEIKEPGVSEYRRDFEFAGITRFSGNGSLPEEAHYLIVLP
jgi:hypothetical protein